MTTSFNFDSIDSPADLMEANENIQSPFAQALEALEDCGYRDSLLVVGYLLTNLIDYHHNTVMNNEDGKGITAYNAFTEGKLAASKAILQPLLQEAIDSITGADEEEDTEES